MIFEATDDTEVTITGVGTGMGYSLSIERLVQVLGATVVCREGPGGGGAGIAGVSIDSRTIRPGDCFFAIAGENFDGHNYVREVLQKGAACAVVCRAVNGEPILGPILRVPDTIRALGELAREYRRMNAFTVVAVTGSVGKTTTRQIIHHVLSRRFRTHQAQKSFNNNIGLPLTLLGAGAEVEVVIAELGANHPGEIAHLTRIARPDIAVVTNVYPAHLEGFGTLDTIVREKLSIAEGLSGDGTLIINADIEPLAAAARNSAMIRGEGILPLCPVGILPASSMGVPPMNRSIHGQDARATQGQDALATSGWHFCTFGKSPDATYRADHIVCNALNSTFTIRGTQVHLPLPGPGNVENALAAWAACDRLGVTAEEFAEAVKGLPSVSMRAEPLRIGTLTVLNDCYNANPASMKNALAMLRNLRSPCSEVSRAGYPRLEGETLSTRWTPAPGSRLVFICGDMAELGPQTEALHADLGRAVADAGVDLLVTVGESSRVTARVAREAARHDLQTKCFADTLLACDQMQEFIRPDDIILVKGSRVARLERVVEKLMKDYG